MIKPAVIIIFLISLIALISLTFNFKQLNQIHSQNKVVRVVDGDTFQLASGKRVRLMGVDGPEFDNCGGSEAKTRLTELVKNKEVELREFVTEAYGRSLALVYVDDKLVNKIIMEEGWGRPDYRKNSERASLTKAYHDAQKAKMGVWGKCISKVSPNPKCTIKGNIDPASYEKFYHLPACRHYNQTVLNLAYGEKWFCSEEEAVASGFKKTKSC